MSKIIIFWGGETEKRTKGRAASRMKGASIATHNSLSIHRHPRVTQPEASMVNFAPVNAGAAFWLRRLIVNIARTKPVKLSGWGGRTCWIQAKTTSGRKPSGRPPVLFPLLKQTRLLLCLSIV